MQLLKSEAPVGSRVGGGLGGGGSFYLQGSPSMDIQECIYNLIGLNGHMSDVLKRTVSQRRTAPGVSWLYYHLVFSFLAEQRLRCIALARI